MDNPGTTFRVAFYRGPGSVVHKIIKWWTGSSYSHVELVLPDDARVGIRPWKEGVVKCWKEVEDDLEHWDFVAIPATSDQFAKINEFFEDTHGQPYDWFGVLASHLTPFRLKHVGRWYCSEWVARALHVAGIEEIPHHHERNPGLLYRFLHR